MSDHVLHGFYWGVAVVVLIVVGLALQGCAGAEQLGDAGQLEDAGEVLDHQVLEDAGEVLDHQVLDHQVLEDAGRPCSGLQPCPWGFVCAFVVTDAGEVLPGVCEVLP